MKAEYECNQLDTSKESARSGQYSGLSSSARYCFSSAGSPVGWCRLPDAARALALVRAHNRVHVVLLAAHLLVCGLILRCCNPLVLVVVRNSKNGASRERVAAGRVGRVERGVPARVVGQRLAA